MTETTQDDRDQLRMHERDIDEETAHMQPEYKAANDADRLAKLEDGIRALADVCDFYDTDDVQIHPQWVTKRLRAILGEDGE